MLGADLTGAAMGFGEAISSVFGKYATFSGRARRSEYWYFYLFTVLVGIPAGIIDAVIQASAGGTLGQVGPARAIVQLALLLPSLAVTVRRLHDTNHSGWVIGGFFLFIVAAALVFVGALGAAGANGGTPDFSGTMGILAIVLGLGVIGYGIWMFVLMVSNGNAGANRYGPDPKGPDVAVFS